jgi:hypothetical protein
LVDFLVVGGGFIFVLVTPSPTFFQIVVYGDWNTQWGVQNANTDRLGIDMAPFRRLLSAVAF